LIFSTDVDGWEKRKLHKKSRDSPHTIVLIQTNFEKIIGGFMTVEWKKTEEPGHCDKGTFLFYFD